MKKKLCIGGTCVGIMITAERMKNENIACQEIRYPCTSKNGESVFYSVLYQLTSEIIRVQLKSINSENMIRNGLVERRLLHVHVGVEERKWL